MNQTITGRIKATTAWADPNRYGRSDRSTVGRWFWEIDRALLFMLALLIGTNVGPIITPWASLATLLCLESCRLHGLRIPLPRFMLTGLGLVIVALTASIGVLLLAA